MPLPLPSFPSKSPKILFSIPTSLKTSQSSSYDKHQISRKVTRIFGETLDDGGMFSQKESMFARDKTHAHISRFQSPDDVQSTAYSGVGLFDRTLDAHNDKSQASDEDVEEAPSPITFAPNPAASGSQWSTDEAMTHGQRVEEERQCKSFPRSQIPTDFGVGSVLPSIQTAMLAKGMSPSRKEWLRRRRSSSAGDLPAWSDDLDRMKEELNDKEKAINVRRAQKMEKAC